MTPDCLLADAISYELAGPHIPCDRPVRITLMLSGKRYEFDTVVLDDAVKIELNRELRVRGIALALPTRVLESQRRAHFRVSVLSDGAVSVILAPAHPQIRGACEVKAKPVRARLVNISAGGMALLIARRELNRVKPSQLFYACFTLPEVDDEFVMLVVVRHARLVASSDSHRVGLAFLPWDGIDLREDLRRVTNYVARRERRQLRRRK